MRCPNCQTLNPPNAKFCLECGNRLVVCPNCQTINLPFAKFCIECGTALHPRSEATTIPLTLPPSTQATGSLTAPLPPPEERRVVTVMFADITGSTPLADRLDPEDMRAILTGYFNLMTEQIRKHGGTVEKYIGDAVMAVFGAPIAHEDDPDRAIRAALDMQFALTAFNEQRQAQDSETTRLQMRIGINTGEVAAPSGISHQRQDFLITGDAVNVAARLQQVATPDTILVGGRTYLSSREVFDFRPIASLHLKGKPEPIEAYVVQGLRERTATITQHPRGIEGRQAPLVGRALDLRLMHTNYARVQAERRPHLITILGLPGIGKSRLVREFIAREQELVKSASSIGKVIEPKVLQGRCPPYGEGITYWPLIEILRSLLQVQDGDSNDYLQKRFIEFVTNILATAKRNESADEIGNAILRSIGRGLNDTVERPIYGNALKDHQSSKNMSGIKQSGTQVAMLRAWRVLFEALAEQQPLIIIIDDLQWADEALLTFLEYLTDRITAVPILFLCPARPDFFERKRDWGGGKRNFTTIELEALSRDETSDLVDELLNTTELPEVLRNTILTRAEGNPFFVEELIRMLIDQGVLVNAEDYERGAAYWRLGQGNNLVSELTTPGEHLDDSLINAHYLFPLRVPDTIQGVLTARVDLLNPVEKLVLQHASIIGRTFWLAELLELASNMNGQTVQDALHNLIQRDFVAEETEKQTRSPIPNDQMFIFQHTLIKDVVYSTIPRLRRSQEHARLAIWLEEKTAGQQEAFIETLAHHYTSALALWSSGLSMNAIKINNPVDPSAEPLHITRPELRLRAIRYLTLAGDQALHSYHTIRALQAYNDALDLLTDSQATPLLQGQMHVKRGDAYAQRGNMDEAWQEYRAALPLFTEEGDSAEATDLLMLYERLAESATRWQGGWFNTPPHEQTVQGYINAGLALLADQPISPERVAFLSYQTFWYSRTMATTHPEQKNNLAEQALSSGREALQLAEELNNPKMLSMALDAMGLIYNKLHRYNDAQEMQLRRLKLEAQLTEREELYDIYHTLGYTYEETADYSAALMWFGRAWSNAQTMESPLSLLSSLTGRMRAWRQWNRWENASQVAQEILRLIEQYQQDEKKQFWAMETLATIAYRTGNQEQGDSYARQCKRLMDQQVERSEGRAKSLEATGMHAIHLASEDWTRATADYKEKLRTSEPFPSPETVSTLAELMVMTGTPYEEQKSICERAIKLAEQSGARKSLAVALRAMGRMHTEQQNWEMAEDNLRASLHLCEVLDLPWERANTLYYLGILYKRRSCSPQIEKASQRNSDWGRARYHFEQALGFFESLKATPATQRVRLALLQDTTVRI